MRKKARVILEYALAIAVVILLGFAIAGVIVVKFHGEELEAYVVDQISEQVDARIDVDDISVKVFHKFPHTSLVIRNVCVWSSHNFSSRDFHGVAADTLLTAESISISFHLPKLIRKKFDIRQVEIKQGSLQILTDQHGEGNYRFLKDMGKRESHERVWNISQLRISGMDLLVDNRAKELLARAHLEDLELNGRFSKKNTQLRVNLEAWLEEISNNGIRYASERSLALKVHAGVVDSVYTLNSGQLQIDRITADVDGQLRVRPKMGLELALLAAARDLEIHEVLDLLPSELAKPLQEIRGSGKLEVAVRINGMASSTLTPSVEADFQTTKADLFWERTPFALKDLNLKGSYSNGGQFNPQSTSLEITEISARIGKDELEGKGSIRNFLNPDFDFSLKGSFHPGQWINWYEQIPIYRAKGLIHSDVKVKGRFERKGPRGERFQALDISGKLALENVQLGWSEESLPFTKLNGSLSIDNDFWEPSFSGKLGKTDFSMKGTGRNLISFFLGSEENLIASASFHSEHMDLQEILDQLPRDPSGERVAVRFPDHMDLRLEFAIDDFVKDKLKAKRLRGVAFYDSPLFFVDSLSMQAMKGTLRGSFGLAQDRHGSIASSVDASLFGLDIHELFYAFNNFGQKQLTSDHLLGSISGSCMFSANFDSTFRILPASILSENEVSILNGELNGFSPIMALSRFVDVEELQNIRFETLQNNILIKDQQVFIPAMDIQSNALNLSASGIHYFNNHYDYRLKLKLSQLLYRKAKRGKRGSEFNVSEDESDTRTLFLKIVDEGSGPSVELDKEQASQKIKQDLSKEKTELKQILNKELGLFKNDEAATQQREEKETEGESLRFIFDEEEDSIQVQADPQKKRRKRNRVKSDTAENKEAPKFVIDE